MILWTREPLGMLIRTGEQGICLAVMAAPFVRRRRPSKLKLAAKTLAVLRSLPLKSTRTLRWRLDRLAELGLVQPGGDGRWYLSNRGSAWLDELDGRIPVAAPLPPPPPPLSIRRKATMTRNIEELAAHPAVRGLAFVSSAGAPVVHGVTPAWQSLLEALALAAEETPGLHIQRLQVAEDGAPAGPTVVHVERGPGGLLVLAHQPDTLLSKSISRTMRRLLGKAGAR